MRPIFFSSPAEFREWLKKYHDKKAELLVGFYKKKSGKPTLTWPQSVDEALCFGWIDGIRKSIDESRYTIRFTPRKPGSIWSSINIKKVEELQAAGLMKPAGLEAFSKRKEKKSGIYPYELEPVLLDKSFEALFKKRKKAWQFFQSQPAYYKKVWAWRIMSAKQDQTRLKRLNALIAASEKGLRI